MQTPPGYSAIKKDGVPMYKRARAGKETEIEARPVVIRSLDLTSFDGAEIGFRTLCSKGTYVRSLARDIGEALGSCAHLTSLRRTMAGGYEVEGALSLDPKPSPEDAIPRVLPLDGILQGLPAVSLSPSGAAGVRNGTAPEPDDITGISGETVPGGPVRLVDGAGRLLAVAETAGYPGGVFRPKTVLG